MLAYLDNNFVLSALVAFILVVLGYLEDRNNREKTLKNYIRKFGIIFLIVLGVLFLRTKNFSLPSMKMSGGGNTISNNPNFTPLVKPNTFSLEEINIGEPTF